MKLIDGQLYLEWGEAISCGIPKGTMDAAKNRNSPSWSFLTDPDDRRKVLIGYDELKGDNKAKVDARYGNPYTYLAQKPIRDMVRQDEKAEQFYLNYRYCAGDKEKSLPQAHVQKYTTAASWLNMLVEQTADKRDLKKSLNLSMDEFYNQVIDIIQIDKIYLPTSQKRLKKKIREYAQKSYESLIDWRFGNKLAAKVEDEVCEAVLMKMIEHPNQYDDVYISMKYSQWAKENGYKSITPAAVGIHRREKEYQITMGRYGNEALQDKYLPQTKGFRPTQPMFLVESDDNHLDLVFADPDNPRATRRYIAMVVTDSYNDYVLGYAYALSGTLSEGQSISLVKAAYLNAMYYLRSITGSWYLPHELKTDRWAISSLEPFYSSLGRYFKTPVLSKRRGYIEQFFGSPHWKRCLKARANNYTGNNITRLNRGVNVDVLRQNAKYRPLIGDEATTQIETFFHNLRYMDTGNGQSKHDQWMAAWTALSSADKREISDEQYLLKFGVEHNTRGKGLRITNRGVEPRINGVKYSYDLITDNKMPLIGKSVSVYYDPYDMSRVLVTDHENVRLLARDARINPRATKDYTTDSQYYLNSIRQEKKDYVNRIAEKSEERSRILESADIDAESLIQAGVLVKEIKQAAERKALAEIIDGQNDDEDIFNQM